MSETVKRYDPAGHWGSNLDKEIPDGPYVLYSDYAALSKRLAETEAIAKSLLDKAPAQADELRRMGAQVVELEREKAVLAVALVRATEQGVQRFGMENKPTLFHCFISAWERAFPLIVALGLATEEESGVEIMVDEAKVDALDEATIYDSVTPVAALSAKPHAEVSGDSVELKEGDE